MLEGDIRGGRPPFSSIPTLRYSNEVLVQGEGIRDSVGIYYLFSFHVPPVKFNIYGWEGLNAEYRNIRVRLPAEEAEVFTAGY
ncbi:MAG: hypothetical protein O3B01_03140 [Planctomycetota bacterium]|nr:hypothetical protein [Planctomycetota bacterium]MDA1137554.1 hypothetical protein [Planctomycetota bacterium]